MEYNKEHTYLVYDEGEEFCKFLILSAIELPECVFSLASTENKPLKDVFVRFINGEISIWEKIEEAEEVIKLNKGQHSLKILKAKLIKYSKGDY